VIIGSFGEYSPIITEPEANLGFFFGGGTEFILVSLNICLSVTSTKRLAAILQISVLLYSPVGEVNITAE
jgi:hypothetical protein